MPRYECSSCDLVETITAFIPEACSSCGGRLALTEAEQTAMSARIARQNDRFRMTWAGDAAVSGQLVVTEGVMAKGAAFVARVREAMQGFTAFTEDNDPYGERDFGAVTVAGVEVWWKIDLYDAAFSYGSELRDDLAVTRRVLTLLLPEEY